MIGPALMAAPVIAPGVASRRIVLPRGAWFDWYDGRLLEGGGEIEAEAPLERMPLFVRADVAIPTQPEVRYADDRPEQPLIWEVFLTPGATGQIGWVYEDDGHSFAYQRGQMRLTRVLAEDSALRLTAAEGSYVSPRTSALVRLHGPGVRAAAGDHAEVPHDGHEHVVSLIRG
jgi:alpha-glucosidase (family GH31 glycosyl hydrolase)